MFVRNSIHRLAVCGGLAGMLGASLSGCGGGGSTVNPPQGGTRAVCNPNTSVAGRAKWTVLVFMNAANNLQPDSLTNIAQMVKVGSDANLNIVVQWKQANCNDCGNPTFQETRRYKLSQHSQTDINQILAGNTTVLNGDLLPPPPAPYYNSTTKQTDMGDWRVLKDFVQWGTANYPSDNLAVVIWDHGSGWRPTRSAGNRLKPRYRAVSQDNETSNEIDTTQLPTALTLANKIDAMIFDASLEQMLEVQYEIRNIAKVMIGSEESPPGAGYPYDLWLTDLKNSGTDGCAVGNSIVTRFVNYYAQTNPGFTNITQSVIDLTTMSNIASALNAFGASLRQHKSDDQNAIQLAREQAQNYAYPENKDLYHYAELIRQNATHSDLRQAAVNLQTAINGTGGSVIYNGVGALNQANSHGIAIYVPLAVNYNTAYDGLALSKAGAAPNWSAFLKEQVR